MTNSAEAGNPQFGSIKDLTDELTAQCSESIRAVLEIARIRMFQARFAEARSLLNSACALPIYEYVNVQDRARILLLQAEVMLYQAVFANDGHDEAFGPVEAAEAIGEESADDRLLADAQAVRAWILCYRELAAGRPRDAVLEPAERSLKLRRKLGHQIGVAESLFLLGLANEHKADRDAAKAEGLFREVLELTESLGEKRWRSYATRHLGWICLNRGELDKALGYLEESLRLRQEIGFVAFLPPAYHAVGLVQLERGKLDEALAHCQLAYDLGTKIGMERYRFIALLALGEAHEKRGEPEEATGCYQQALAMAPSFGDTFTDEVKAAIERVESSE